MSSAAQNSRLIMAFDARLAEDIQFGAYIRVLQSEGRDYSIVNLFES